MSDRNYVARLFEPCKIGSRTIRNRFVLGPMSVLSPTPEGRPTEQTAAFFAARAKGGVGLIIAGGTITSERGFKETPYKGVLRADVDQFVPDLARVADAVHAFGMPIISEVMPGFGRMAVARDGLDLIAASSVKLVIPKGRTMPLERVMATPRTATLAEVEDCERRTVEGALRLHRAGWDGVEIAAHMSYFFASFLTPRTNFREDAYGGTVANRARILVNIVRGIRAAAGPDFIIGLRLSSNELLADGQDARGYAEIAREVEAAGLDYVAPTPGCYESINEIADPKAILIDSGDLKIFRDSLAIPVLMMGVHRTEDAAQAIANGHADFTMLARPLLADPELPNKLLAGKPETIVRCDGNNHCIQRLMMQMPVRCTLNPAMGREAEIAKGASLVDRSIRRRIEDAAIAFSTSKFVMGLASAALSRRNRRAKGNR